MTLARARPTSTGGVSASAPQQEYICWSKMQAEAGQALPAIIRRKELERRAGGGQFCRGVGNAPSVAISSFSRLHEPIEVIFSIMKSRPKPADVTPSRTVVWRRYIDRDGGLRPLPAHALVTSRADSGSGPKTKHFALLCWSDEPLRLRYGEPFDPNAFRNVGGAGASVGASQVTALLRRTTADAGQTDYEVNLRASLTGDYWVRLADPIELCSDFHDLDVTSGSSTQDWLEFVALARGVNDRKSSESSTQGLLL
jgi:hypothetical protein